uniref:Protein DGCR6 n=1 Tax=Sarcophilus harrisii TaxID=9305 RepID=G3VAR0_SARHA
IGLHEGTQRAHVGLHSHAHTGTARTAGQARSTQGTQRTHRPSRVSIRSSRRAPGRGGSFQQRLSHTTLSDLALVLIDGTVFEIVQGLLEIQHLTEKSLYNQRLKLQSEHRVLKQTLLNKHKEAQQACRPHNLPILRAAQQREQEAMEHRIREEQRMMDEKIVLELDQKVVDQQSTLEKAGVTGFYVTTNPQELTLQMNLLELIRKLQQRGYQPGKPFP